MKTSRDYNYGLCLLRLLMCFAVVLTHFWHMGDYTGNWVWLKSSLYYHVPVFVLLSFALTGDVLQSKNMRQLGRRIRRLYLPVLLWAVVYFLAYKCADSAVQWGNNATIQDLLWQCTTGHSQKLNPPMWFNVVVLLLTLLIWGLCFFLSKRVVMLVLAFMSMGALYMEYSGLSMGLFGHLRYELAFPLGRLIEMLPYSVVGFAICETRCMNRLKEYWFVSVPAAFGCLIMLFIPRSEGFLCAPEGFGYSGVQNIMVAFLLMVGFYCLPLHRLPNPILTGLRRLGSYTMGIYCMHMLVGNVLCFVFPMVGLPKGTILLCFVTFAVSMLCSYLMAHLPWSLVRQMVE